MTELSHSTPPTPESSRIASGLEELLRKYIAVWLWSILFGGTTGLTYTMFSFSRGEKWGPLALSLGIATAFAIYFLAMAWFYLYVYLRDFLIPDVLIGRQESESVDRDRGGRVLLRAYLLMIITGVVGLSIRAIQYVFQALQF